MNLFKRLFSNNERLEEGTKIVNHCNKCSSCDDNCPECLNCNNFTLLFHVNQGNLSFNNDGSLTITDFLETMYSSGSSPQEYFKCKLNPVYRRLLININNKLSRNLTCLSNYNNRVIISYSSDNNQYSGILSCNINLTSAWTNLILYDIEYLGEKNLIQNNNYTFYIFADKNILNNLLLYVYQPVQISKCIPTNITSLVSSNMNVGLYTEDILLKCKNGSIFARYVYGSDQINNPFIYFLSKYCHENPYNVYLYFNTPNLTEFNTVPDYNLFGSLQSEMIKVGLYSENGQLYIVSEEDVALISGLISKHKLGLNTMTV